MRPRLSSCMSDARSRPGPVESVTLAEAKVKPNEARQLSLSRLLLDTFAIDYSLEI
ncbi:hypothetical protein Tco_1281378, partial [Tanacetum coccineum]